MDILDRPSLKDLTTLRLGGRAQCGIWIRSEADWDELSAFLEREGLDPVCLGRGSNILAREGDLPLALIMQAPTRELEGTELPDGRVRIAVDAGMGMGRLLAGLQRRGLSGLEGLTGIPASLGGAVAMNAGAYGCETAGALVRVRVWTPRHGGQWLGRERLDWAYREFDPGLDNFFCITQAELELEPSTPAKVRQRMRECFRAKKRSQPVSARTCGCVFKNPSDGPEAGALLERCGFRGCFLGNVGFSKEHANFLINSGGGKADQALELIDGARTAVLGRFGIDLEREVRLLE